MLFLSYWDMLCTAYAWMNTRNVVVLTCFALKLERRGNSTVHTIKSFQICKSLAE
eukprot:c39404_g1_i1 orf=144-308(+)